MPAHHVTNHFRKSGLAPTFRKKSDMKSNRTPYTKLGNTINAVTVSFSVGRTKHEVHVPAGQKRCVH